MDPDQASADDHPSRSARRRDALDVLALASQLADLSPARLAQLDLPEDVRECVADVRRTPSHIAHKREVAHLAKVLRTHAPDELAPARAAIANAHGASARDAAALHQVETWRERLLGETGDAALAEFITTHPDVDRQHLRALIRQARRERDTAKPPRAQRELFRLLRNLEAESSDADTR